MIKMIWEFIKIGAFTYGGGLAMIPLLREVAVSAGWLTNSQFADLIAIAQATPGPIAINMATYIGFLEYGYRGAILISLAVVLPASILAIFIAKFLNHFNEEPAVKAAMIGLKPAIIGLLATSILQVAMVSIYEYKDGISFYKGVDFKAVLFLLISLLLIYKLKKHPVVYIAIGGIVGIFVW